MPTNAVGSSASLPINLPPGLCRTRGICQLCWHVGHSGKRGKGRAHVEIFHADERDTSPPISTAAHPVMESANRLTRATQTPEQTARDRPFSTLMQRALVHRSRLRRQCVLDSRKRLESMHHPPMPRATHSAYSRTNHRTRSWLPRSHDGVQPSTQRSVRPNGESHRSGLPDRCSR